MAAAGGGAGGADIMSTLACGAGGVEEMAKFVPEGQALFGMIRVTVGSGTFKRDKLILASIMPAALSGIKKAKVANKKAAVKGVLGDVHAEWVVEDAAAMTVEGLLEAVKHIAADNAVSGFNIKQAKADYEAMIAAAQAAKGGAGGGAGAPVKINLLAATGRKTASEMAVKVPADVALKAVRETMGPFNWLLVAPTDAGKPLELVNAGSLSVNGARARRRLAGGGRCRGWGYGEGFWEGAGRAGSFACAMVA